MTLRQTESLRFRSTFDTGMKEDSINVGSFRESVTRCIMCMMRNACVTDSDSECQFEFFVPPSLCRTARWLGSVVSVDQNGK